MSDKRKVVLPFKIGEKYITKFQVPEEVTLTRIAPNPKGKRPLFGHVIYTNSPHLGECPLNLDRIFPKVVNEDNNKQVDNMEIKTCRVCKGTGEVETREEREDIMKPCSNCNATGKVYIRTYELEIPFGDLGRYYNADEKIIDIIRNK